jgi:hypothetical protein
VSACIASPAEHRASPRSARPDKENVLRTAIPLLVVLSTLALPARGATLTLANGDLLHGEIVEQTEASLVLEHPQLGLLEITRSALGKAAPPSRPAETKCEASPAQATGPAPASGVAEPQMPPRPRDDADPDEEGAGEGEESGLFGTRLLRGWTSRFGAGITGSAGGFEDTKLNLLFNTRIRDEKRRWEFDSAYFFNVTPKRENQTSTISKNQAFVSLRRDWLFPDAERWRKWFAFAQTRWDFDEFQPWEHRIAVNGGPGYHLIDTEKWQLKLRLGVGGSASFGGFDDVIPELMGGFDLKWTPHAVHAFSTRNELYFDMLGPGRWRTVQSFAWDIDISGGWGLGFRLAALYKFDTESTGRANDLTYLSSLTYDF